MSAYERFDIEHDGRTFHVELHFDDSRGAPWDEECGHGPVSGWTRRDKAPGELVLCEDRGWRRFYDFAEATRIARADGWGLAPDEEAALAQTLGRAPTAKEIRREAVMRDYRHLKAWCNDEWHYCGVVVRHDELDEDASLWGVENSSRDYVEDCARQLAGELAARIVEDEAKLNEALLSVALAARLV